MPNLAEAIQNSVPMGSPSDISYEVMIEGHDKPLTTRALRYVNHDDDSKCYYAVKPESTDGQPCRFFGVINPENQRVEPPAPAVFAAANGFSRDKSQRKQPDRDQKAAAKAKLATGLASARTFIGMDDSSFVPGKHLAYLLNRVGAGVTVTKKTQKKDGSAKPMTKTQIRLLTDLGLGFAVVQCAIDNDLWIEVDVQKWITARTSSRYVKVVEGTWDDEAKRIAITSDLSKGEVDALRAQKLTLKNPPRRN
jgi:hypothetical protein